MPLLPLSNLFGLRQRSKRLSTAEANGVPENPANGLPAAEPLKTVVTDENTVVLLADFYRAGDGNDESFTAQMIVSAEDIAPDIAGIQNVWIQGVGCASAIANFSS